MNNLVYLLQCSYLTGRHSHDSDPLGLLFIVAALIVLSLYLYATNLLITRNKDWRSPRIISFIIGISLILFAFMPSSIYAAHHSLYIHTLQHLVLGMFAPIFLVVGAPLTLSYKVLPPVTSRRITRLLSSHFVQWLTHPVVALLLNIGSLYALYLTGIYGRFSHESSFHYVMMLHFLFAGYLFTWSIIGSDPSPHRATLRLRLLVLFLSIGLHACLSKLMYARLLPKGTIYSKAEIQASAKLMYYGGDLAEFVVLVILFYQWYERKRTADRIAYLLD